MGLGVCRTCLVSEKGQFSTGHGGAQWCTQEYLSTLEAAGIKSEKVLYSTKRTLPIRIINRLFPYPFRGLHPSKIMQRLEATVRDFDVNLILLNNADAGALAPRIRVLFPTARIVFLSHGVEITDVVNNLNLAPQSLPSAHRKSRWLGNLLKYELKIREALDGAVCISEEDVQFEHWLGLNAAVYLPRQVKGDLLSFCSQRGRIGTVGTLNHGPNIHGIKLLASRLQNGGKQEFRIVGGPESIGRQLAEEFSVIRYLGPLSDQQLESEASTWMGFVNPVFCHARGASTKVARALAWGLPVLTTKMGARGYLWDTERLPVADSPDELAQLCEKVSTSSSPEIWRNHAKKIARLAPSLDSTANKLKEFLKRLSK